MHIFIITNNYEIAKFVLLFFFGFSLFLEVNASICTYLIMKHSYIINKLKLVYVHKYIYIYSQHEL